MATLKLRQMGYDIQSNQGYAKIAALIRQAQPALANKCRHDLFGLFLGVGEEADKLAADYREYRAGRREKQKARHKKREDFYASQEWLALRYRALVLHGGACQCCGATRHDGVKLHVDHIKPRSKFPALELELSNLQVLCETCNLGKSNKDETDWRPAEFAQ